MHGFNGFGCCGGWGGMGGFGLFGGLLGLLFNLALIVGIILVAVWLFRRLSAGGQSPLSGQSMRTQSELSPRDILKQRYARGEITREQYEEMLRDIS